MSAETLQNYVGQGTRHLLPRCHFPACRKLHRRRHRLPLPASPKKVPGAVQSRATWPQRQGPWLVKLEDTPPLRPRPRPTHRLTGYVRGRGGGEGGAKAACRETWSGGRGAVPAGSSPPRALLHNLAPSPQPPCPLPHRLRRSASERRLGVPGAPGTKGISELA